MKKLLASLAALKMLAAPASAEPFENQAGILQFINSDEYPEEINQIWETSLFKSIELKNVNFSYPSRDLKVIDGLSIKINKGESVGIIGKSGSGKTTLLDILLGLI